MLTNGRGRQTTDVNSKIRNKAFLWAYDKAYPFGQAFVIYGVKVKQLFVFAKFLQNRV